MNNRRFAGLNLGFGIAALGALALLAGLAIYATNSAYAGTCYGFTDGSWSCSWEEFFAAQLFYALLLGMLPLAGLFALWGGASAGILVWRRMRQRRLPATIGAALAGGIAGGALGVGLMLALMSLLEVSASR